MRARAVATAVAATPKSPIIEARPFTRPPTTTTKEMTP
jgi:hypothetical protein